MPMADSRHGANLARSDRRAHRDVAAILRAIETHGWPFLGICAATLLRLLLEPWVGERLPYTLYLPVILAAAAYRGTRAAVAATVFGAVAGSLVVSPFESDRIHLLGLVIFLGVSAGTIRLTREIVAWRDKAVAEHSVAARQASDARIVVDELTLLIDAASNHAIYFLDTEGTITLWSPSAVRICGWSEREAVGCKFDLFYTAADRLAGKPQHALAAARELGRFRARGERRRKDGSTFIADVTLTALFDTGGRLRGFGKVMQDVTEEARAARELELRERQLSSILATVPEATIVTGNDGCIVSFSRTAQSLFGYSETDVVGCDASMLLQSLSGNTDLHLLRFNHLAEIGPRRGTARRADGTVFPIQITVGRAAIGDSVQFTGFIRDLSGEAATRARMLALQQQLLHMSRVSAMGTMAATLAHELNQPLAAVESYIGAARNLLPPGMDDGSNDLDTALAGASGQALRAAAIIRRTREMLARRDIELVHEDLAALLVEAKNLACMGAADLPTAIELALEPELGSVLVDKVQIQQVVFNLLRNAFDAVRDAPVRRVRLGAVARSQEIAQITVSDSGCGLSPDESANIFDAFFGTKIGGLGLGLSICRTIVEVHGGRIWAGPRPGGGTEFHFTLRRSKRGEDRCRRPERSMSSTMIERSATLSE